MRKIFLLLFIASLLSACVCQNCPPYNPYAHRLCGDLIAPLEQQGIQVIQIGDTLRIIIPADKIFDPAGTKIKPGCAGIFPIIAKLVVCHCYWILPISVKGYSDNVGTIRDQKARALQQARNVAAFLWSNGIPLQRMRIYGYGARGTIATNQTNVGSYYNRRVEITLP